MVSICPKCKQNIGKNDAFCPHCGFQLKKDGTVSKAEKIKIYVISFLFAPFGLYWFFKYRNNKNPANRLISKVVLWLTLIAIALMIVLGIVSAKAYSNFLNSYLI